MARTLKRIATLPSENAFSLHSNPTSEPFDNEQMMLDLTHKYHQFTRRSLHNTRF